MNGESEKCLVQRTHGEDGTRENVPSPGRIISVSFTFPLGSSVILEFPAISKSDSSIVLYIEKIQVYNIIRILKLDRGHN